MRPRRQPDDYGIYVHIPWCRVRCAYCAFVTWTEADPPWAAWLASVLADWQHESAHFSGAAHSLYLGGGTPSLAPPELIGALIRALPLQDQAEVTLEVNPGTADAARLRAFCRAGVTRLSLGIQTFQARHARLLGRAHSVGEARALLGEIGQLPLRSWSFDLIFGLPGQALEELEADLDQLVEVQPPHVSLYGLTYEPDTPLTKARDSGRLVALDADRWRAQHDLLASRLQGGGWERYEVSNFARPGHRARHNEAVWRGGAYAGLGPAAHGLRPCGTRTVQPAHWPAWVGRQGPTLETCTPKERALDLVLTQTRHCMGLDLDRLERTTGHRVDPSTIHTLCAGGLVQARAGRLSLTEAGFPLADAVIRRLAKSLSVSVRDFAAGDG